MCEFCDGKEKRIENGFTYGNAYITKNRLNKSYSLNYDNSGDEYGEGEFEINYCPICGRKLVEELKETILYISKTEEDIKSFLKYLKRKLEAEQKECILDEEHNILIIPKYYDIVGKNIYGNMLGTGYGYFKYYCFSETYNKDKYCNAENEKLKEILMHTREGADRISEIDILYMLGLV